MSVVSKIFGFPTLTLAAAVEALVAIKLFPEYYGARGYLAAVGTLLCANWAAGLVFWVVLHPRFFSPLRKLPGPRTFSSAVNKALVVRGRPSGDLFIDLANEYPGEDFIVLNARGTQVALMNPKLMADLLVHRCYDYSKPKMIASFLRYVLGDGLIIVEEDHHKFLRKNTMPAFHYRHIKELYPMMWSKTETLMKALKEDIKETGSSVTELNGWASKVTLDIIGIAGLGRKFDTVEKRKDPLAEIYERILDTSRERLIFSMLCIIFGRTAVGLIPWRMNAEFNYLTASLDAICRPMIDEKRIEIAEKGDDHFDILSLLMKAGTFTDEALKDQLLTFLAAGHETTASAFTWACYLLTKHPDIQEKLRAEIKENLPEDVGSMPAAELASLLEQLPLLNGVMQETLRLYPTVPLTMREALRDTQLGGQFIPKGTDVAVPIWAINRSTDIWGPHATEFRPQRWISEDGKPNQNGGASSNYDFMTFLHGPRSCIGQGFAKAEMRCLLAGIVRSFSWELEMDESLVMPRGVVTIRPENGMYLRLTPLDVKAQ